MTTKYVLSSEYITQKVGDKVTVFSGKKSELVTFNDSAALIFQGLKLGWSEEKIAQKLVENFTISEISAKEDIKNFVKELLDKKILIKGKD